MCSASNHYCGGTSCGKDFLQKHATIPTQFLSSLNQGPCCCKSEDNRETLRKAVQKILNLKYALASGNPKAKVPYGSFKDKVCGFPEDLKFGPPSSFSSQALQKILDKADEIFFCLTTNASSSSGSVSSINDHDHCYTKPSHEERTAAKRKRKGQTFLTPVTDHDIQELTTSTTNAVHMSM